jgi:hypothetical protein
MLTVSADTLTAWEAGKIEVGLRVDFGRAEVWETVDEFYGTGIITLAISTPRAGEYLEVFGDWTTAPTLIEASTRATPDSAWGSWVTVPEDDLSAVPLGGEIRLRLSGVAGDYVSRVMVAYQTDIVLPQPTQIGSVTLSKEGRVPFAQLHGNCSLGFSLTPDQWSRIENGLHDVFTLRVFVDIYATVEEDEFLIFRGVVGSHKSSRSFDSIDLMLELMDQLQILRDRKADDEFMGYDSLGNEVWEAALAQDTVVSRCLDEAGVWDRSLVSPCGAGETSADVVSYGLTVPAGHEIRGVQDVGGYRYFACLRTADNFLVIFKWRIGLFTSTNLPVVQEAFIYGAVTSDMSAVNQTTGGIGIFLIRYNGGAWHIFLRLDDFRTILVGYTGLVHPVASLYTDGASWTIRAMRWRSSSIEVFYRNAFWGDVYEISGGQFLGVGWIVLETFNVTRNYNAFRSLRLGDGFSPVYTDVSFATSSKIKIRSFDYWRTGSLTPVEYEVILTQTGATPALIRSASSVGDTTRLSIYYSGKVAFVKIANGVPSLTYNATNAGEFFYADATTEYTSAFLRAGDRLYTEAGAIIGVAGPATFTALTQTAENRTIWGAGRYTGIYGPSVVSIADMEVFKGSSLWDVLQALAYGNKFFVGQTAGLVFFGERTTSSVSFDEGKIINVGSLSLDTARLVNRLKVTYGAAGTIKTYIDAASVTAYGIHDGDLSLVWMEEEDAVDIAANEWLDRYAQPQSLVDIEAHYSPFIEVTDSVVIEVLPLLDSPGEIIKIAHNPTGEKTTMTIRVAIAPDDLIWGVSEYGG